MTVFPEKAALGPNVCPVPATLKRVSTFLVIASQSYAISHAAPYSLPSLADVVVGGSGGRICLMSCLKGMLPVQAVPRCRSGTQTFPTFSRGFYDDSRLPGTSSSSLSPLLASSSDHFASTCKCALRLLPAFRTQKPVRRF